MPCQDYWPNKTPAEVAQDDRINQLSKRNDLLARIACCALQALETTLGSTDLADVKDALAKAGVAHDHIKEVLLWWPKHKEEDKKQSARKELAEKEEKKRKRAQLIRDLGRGFEQRDQYNRQMEAFNLLSDEKAAVLGVKKPTKPRELRRLERYEAEHGKAKPRKLVFPDMAKAKGAGTVTIKKSTVLKSPKSEKSEK